MQIKILARLGEFDIELVYGSDDVINGASDAIEIVNGLIADNPEIKPRPRFQNNKAALPEMPFVGTIEKTELVPAKDGKKEYCLAHVTHTDGTVVPVRYFPPQKTWRAGEKVKVQKGQYGPELKETEEEDIPF